MDDFFQMVSEIASYLFFVLAIIFYVAYQSQLTAFTYIMSIVLLIVAVVFGFGRSYARYRRSLKASESASEESQLRADVSPLALLKYDLLAWLCVALIIGSGFFIEEGMMTRDIVHASIALVGFSVARRVLVK